MWDRRKVLKGVGLSAAAVAARPIAFAATDEAPIVKTTAGLISGAKTARGGLVFKGIPYGADTRNTRFQAPLPVASWTGVKECIKWGPRAPQQAPDRKGPAPAAVGFAVMDGAPQRYHLPPDEGPQSEDCLHVNVWTPAIDGKKRAVLFYIHGGAYNNGTVNAELYDGARLTERGDVVVVTVNHRLNAFGYMYLAGLPGLAAKYRESGNVGMLDLVLALQWVKANIGSFGGDAGSVTIFGQSGGGASARR